MEVKLQIDVLDRRLADNEFVAGADYTIADMAIWPWYGGLVKGWLYNAAEFLSVQDYMNVVRWVDQISARRSEEHTSELQSLMRNSYAVFCLKKKHRNKPHKLIRHKPV